ncbi:MAG: GDP-mannose 4,6-dehydratase [Candidatus Hydrogenedentes bacterium]|nr:GDP-mannose 4,6-dehydratase [Candidatus Hydrogenedentota bacterium]
MTGRALITGAAGFVGTRLADYLRGRGWDVVCSGHPAREGMIPCDFRDADSVAALLRDAGAVTHVFHLAAIAFVPDAEADPLLAMDVNLNGTIRLSEAMREACPDARLVFIGSADAYGPPQSIPVTEEHPLNPVNTYAISKAAADHYCGRLGRVKALDCVRLRPFNHTGPGQNESYVLSSFARQIAAIEAGLHAPVVRVGNLEAARDFLHVDDVLRAYELAALHGRAGAAYNICSGVSVPIQSALDQLVAMSTVDVSVEQDPARMRPSDVPEIRGCHDRFTEATGWQPEIPFESLLEGLLGYWRAQLAGAPAP